MLWYDMIFTQSDIAMSGSLRRSMREKDLSGNWKEHGKERKMKVTGIVSVKRERSIGGY